MPGREGPKLPTPLEMPLRDIMRGMAGFASIGERAVRSAGSILPAPLEASVLTVFRNLEAAAARILDARIAPEEIARAARFAAGETAAVADAEAFVRVVAFGWARLCGVHQNSREMFSETIAAARLMAEARRPAASGASAAARLLSVLRASPAIGLPPGLPAHRGAAEQAEVDVNLFAIFLWLLAARPEDPGEEEALLDLATVLTEAHRAEVTAEAADAVAVGARLAGLAVQL